MPNPPKLPENRINRNAPESWVVIPNTPCDEDIPEWPLDVLTKSENTYWVKLWRHPIAHYWHDQQISAEVVARYVRLWVDDMLDERGKYGGLISRMEKDLGLHLHGMRQLRIRFEAPEEGSKGSGVDEGSGTPYRHLRPVAGE